jgi:hypothetical protein
MATLKVLAVLLAVIALACWIRRELKIDSCLDLGGRWDYQDSVCESK